MGSAPGAAVAPPGAAVAYCARLGCSRRQAHTTMRRDVCVSLLSASPRRASSSCAPAASCWAEHVHGAQHSRRSGPPCWTRARAHTQVAECPCASRARAWRAIRSYPQGVTASDPKTPMSLDTRARSVCVRAVARGLRSTTQTGRWPCFELRKSGVS